MHGVIKYMLEYNHLQLHLAAMFDRVIISISPQWCDRLCWAGFGMASQAIFSELCFVGIKYWLAGS